MRKAKRDIEPEEELTYDYANASGAAVDEHVAGVSTPRGSTRCLCGASNCRGWMPFDPDV